MTMAVDAAAITANLVVIVVTADAAVMATAAKFVTVAIVAACSSIFVPCLLLHLIFVVQLRDWMSTTP